MLDDLAKLTPNESRLDPVLLREMLAYEHGESMKLFIKRGDGQVIGELQVPPATILR